MTDATWGMIWGVFAVAVAFFLGWKARETMALIYMNSAIKQMEEQLQETQDQDTRKKVKAKIDIIDDIHYVYNLDTDEFLAQGSSYKELQDRLMDRYPDTIFMIAREHLDKVPGFPGLENERI